jgi:hypothetical protein
MEAVREITKWKPGFEQINHDYLLDGDRILAYRKHGENTNNTLSGTIKIDRRGRKFTKLDPNPFTEFKKKSMVVEVSGSKGETYYLNRDEQTCTCPGFTFRGTCKHLNKNG